MSIPVPSPCVRAVKGFPHRHAGELMADNAIQAALDHGKRPGPRRMFVPAFCDLCLFWYVKNISVVNYTEDAPDPEWEVVGCPTGKQWHETEREARDQLLSLKEFGRRRVRRNGTRRHLDGETMARLKRQRERGQELEVYRCKVCDHWHIGHAS